MSRKYPNRPFRARCVIIPHCPVRPAFASKRSRGQLGYTPNQFVSSVFAQVRRSSDRKQMGAMAFLTAHGTRNGWREIATYRDFFMGAKERAVEQGFSVEAHWAAEPGMTGPRLNAILRARGIKGVIVSTRSASEKPLEMAWDQFALVRVGLAQKHLPCHCAVNHQVATMRLVAERLASRGYTRIGLVLSRWQNEVADQNWLAGYMVWQSMQPARNRVPIHLPDELAAKPLIGWLRMHRPDALISVNPDVLHWIKAAGFEVPGKVAFALLDWHGDYGEIAGADQNNRQVGAAAVDILLGQLRRNDRGLPAHPRITLIKSSWRDGVTVA